MLFYFCFDQITGLLVLFFLFDGLVILYITPCAILFYDGIIGVTSAPCVASQVMSVLSKVIISLSQDIGNNGVKSKFKTLNNLKLTSLLIVLVSKLSIR